MSIWASDPILHCKLTHPYEVEVWDDILESVAYDELADTFPAHLAKPFNYNGGLKMNLNRTHPELMTFMRSNKAWFEFYSTVVDRFPQDCTGFKFEFSMLPNGGGLLPHTDTRRKATTAVFYFPSADWAKSYGGEFEIVRHATEPYGDYDQTELLKWEDTVPIMAVPYRGNRAIVMHRNGHSFHGVRPVRCPPKVMRQTVTVCWLKEGKQ